MNPQIPLGVAAPDAACSAVETLLALMKHQRTCRQCRYDEALCSTACNYQQNFMQDVRRYERARRAA
jgi:hypothetical protein